MTTGHVCGRRHKLALVPLLFLLLLCCTWRIHAQSDTDTHPSTSTSTSTSTEPNTVDIHITSTYTDVTSTTSISTSTCDPVAPTASCQAQEHAQDHPHKHQHEPAQEQQEHQQKHQHQHQKEQEHEHVIESEPRQPQAQATVTTDQRDMQAVNAAAPAAAAASASEQSEPTQTHTHANANTATATATGATDTPPESRVEIETPLTPPTAPSSDHPSDAQVEASQSQSQSQSQTTQTTPSASQPSHATQQVTEQTQTSSPPVQTQAQSQTQPRVQAKAQAQAETQASPASTSTSTTPSPTATPSSASTPPSSPTKKESRKKKKAAKSVTSSIPSTLIPTSQLLSTYIAHQYDELTHHILQNIVYLYYHRDMYITNDTTSTLYTPHTAIIHRALLNPHVTTILWLLSQHDYHITYKLAERIFVTSLLSTSTSISSTSTSTSTSTIIHHPYHYMLTTIVALSDIHDTTATLSNHDWLMNIDTTTSTSSSTSSSNPLNVPPLALTNMLLLYNPYVDHTSLTFLPTLFYSVNWLLSSLWFIHHIRHVCILPILSHASSTSHLTSLLTSIDQRQWTIQQYVNDTDYLYHYQTRTHTLLASDVYVAASYIGYDRNVKQHIHAMFRDVLSKQIKQLDMKPLLAKPSTKPASTSTSPSPSPWTQYLTSTARIDDKGWYRYPLAFVVHAWGRESHVFEMYAIILQSVLMHFHVSLVILHPPGTPRPENNDLNIPLYSSFTGGVHHMWWNVHTNTTSLEKDCTWWMSQKFAVIIHADAGLSPYSLFLINHRFAPLQLMGLAHPISTRGAHHIDYVLTSVDVDIPDDAIIQQTQSRWEIIETQQQMIQALGGKFDWGDETYEPLPRWSQWDEVAMRMPHMGFLPMKPGFLRVHARNNTCDHMSPRAPFIIVLPWTIPTTHHTHIDRLRQLQDRIGSTYNITFRFIMIPTEYQHLHDMDDARYHILYQQLTDVLGPSNVQMHVLPHPNNMTSIRLLGTRYDIISQLVHDADMIIESYPKGFGYHIGLILALLQLKIPIITVQGNEWHNRIVSHMLKLAGLQEFITTPDTFLDRLTSLITSPLLHLGACTRFARVDWDPIIYRHYSKSEEDATQRSDALNSMALALDHLIKYHPRIKEAGVAWGDITRPAEKKPL